VTPRELGRFVRAYGAIFQHGTLPKTMTLVQAIGTVTNLNARDDSLTAYKVSDAVFCLFVCSVLSSFF
jgi:hypothetical protein